MTKALKITFLTALLVLLSALLGGCGSQLRRHGSLSSSTINRDIQTSLNNLSTGRDASLYLNFSGSKLGAYSSLLNNLSFSIIHNGIGEYIAIKTGKNSRSGGGSSGTSAKVGKKSSSLDWDYEYNVFYTGKVLLRVIFVRRGYFLINLNKKNIEAVSAQEQTLINPEISYLASLAGNAWYKISLRQLKEATGGISAYLRIRIPNSGQVSEKKPGRYSPRDVIGLIAGALIAAVAPSKAAPPDGFHIVDDMNGTLSLDTSESLENILGDWVGALNASHLALPTLLLGNLKTLTAKLPPINVAVGIFMTSGATGKLSHGSHHTNFYLRRIVESAKSGLAGIVINTSFAYNQTDVSEPRNVVNIPDSLWTLFRFSLNSTLRRYL